MSLLSLLQFERVICVTEIKQIYIYIYIYISEIEDFHGGENIDFFVWVMTPYNYTDDYLSTLSHHIVDCQR